MKFALPMNGVLGMLEMLEENQMCQQLQYLHYANGQLVDDLINDILDFSKIEAGKLI